MSATYRVGTPSDEEALLAIENEAFVYRNDKFGKREMKYMLTKAHAEVVIAEADSGIVGFAVLLFRTGRLSRTGGRWPCCRSTSTTA
jgi:hypothetical protein